MRIALRPLTTPAVRACWRVFPLIALALMATVPEARAGLVTFSQFTGNGSTLPFEFTNGTSGSATFQTMSGGAPVLFTFTDFVLPGLPSDLMGPQNAHLFLDLTTTAPAQTTSGMAIQPFISLGTLKIVRDTPAAEGAGSRQTLLEITFNGSLIGADGGSTAWLTGQSSLGTVTFSSDFLGFDATTSRSLSISFNSLNLPLAIDGSFLRSFQADATGLFSIDGPVTVVPEPSTLITGGLGALALGLLVCRRRNRQRRQSAA